MAPCTRMGDPAWGTPNVHSPTPTFTAAPFAELPFAALNPCEGKKLSMSWSEKQKGDAPVPKGMPKVPSGTAPLAGSTLGWCQAAPTGIGTGPHQEQQWMSLSLLVTLSQLQAFSSLNNEWCEATYSQNPGGRRGEEEGQARPPCPPFPWQTRALHGPCPTPGPAGGEGVLVSVASRSWQGKPRTAAEVLGSLWLGQREAVKVPVPSGAQPLPPPLTPGGRTGKRGAGRCRACG